MNGDELLHTSHAPEARHRSLSPLERSVRILGPIVEMPASFLALLIPNHLHRGPVGWTLVRHHDFGISLSFHCFLEEFQCCSLVTLLRDIGFQNFAFMIHSAPKIMPLAPDPHKDLVQMPRPLGASSHRFRPLLPDLVRKVDAETIDPETDTFVAYIDAALVEQVFDVPKRQWKSVIQEYA
jgi:hypothetical protein